MKQKVCGIYKITNPKGKVYIGQSVNIFKRFYDYKYTGSSNQHKLNNSLNKYGYTNHVFEIISECDIEQLNEQERYYQEVYNSVKCGLNCVYVNSKNKIGYVSDESKKLISEAKKGKKPSLQTREKMSIARKKYLKENPINTTFKTGANLYRNIVCLNMENGVFYDKILEASICHGIKYTTLRAMLYGVNKNKTSLVICR